MKTYKSLIIFGALIFFFFINNSFAQNANEILPKWNNKNDKIISQDWLVSPININASVFKSEDEKDIILYNGLIKRIHR